VLFALIDEGDAPFSEPFDWVGSEIGASLAWVFPQVIEPLAGVSVHAGARHLTDVAVVVDLPGEVGASLGVALVQWGFRPVPLYNAVFHPGALVNLEPVIAILTRDAGIVARAPLDGPPAFLLDAHRMSGAHRVKPGAFDNRSVCRASDFPSASVLAGAKIRRVLVIQEEAGRPASDLEPVLVDWQRHGLELWFKYTDDHAPARPRRLSPRLLVVRLVHAFARALLRRRSDGAYGTIVPTPGGG
jgi:hypothetical protein